MPLLNVFECDSCSKQSEPLQGQYPEGWISLTASGMSQFICSSTCLATYADEMQKAEAEAAAATE